MHAAGSLIRHKPALTQIEPGKGVQHSGCRHGLRYERRYAPVMTRVLRIHPRMFVPDALRDEKSSSRSTGELVHRAKHRSGFLLGEFQVSSGGKYGQDSRQLCQTG